MKTKIFNLLIQFAGVLVAVVGTGCGTLKIPQYTAGPSPQAKSSESQGLVIVVDPVLDSKRYDAYFKVDPNNRGLGIIFLRAENKSPNATWLLSEENMHLSVAAHEGDINAQDQEVEGDYRKGEALLVVAMPFLAVPGIDIIAIPFMLSGSKAISDESFIQKNFVDKEWHSQTLSPGQQAEGFIYFNLERQSQWARSAVLKLDCVEVHSQQTNTITIPLTYETK